MAPKTFREYDAQHPHQVLVLSEQERTALLKVEWESYTFPRYNHQRSKGVLGEWRIGHQDAPRPDGTFEPVGLKYRLPLPEGLDFRGGLESMDEVGRESEEGRRLWAAMDANELGYICSQDYARRFVEVARRSSDTRPPAEILTEGGFKEDEPLNVNDQILRRFTLEVEGEGFFEVILGDSFLKLIYEENEKTYWHNLLRLHLGQENHNATEWIPAYWSPEVASPLSAAASMGVEMAREWRPQSTPSWQSKTRNSVTERRSP